MHANGDEFQLSAGNLSQMQRLFFIPRVVTDSRLYLRELRM